MGLNFAKIASEFMEIQRKKKTLQYSTVDYANAQDGYAQNDGYSQQNPASQNSQYINPTYICKRILTRRRILAKDFPKN